MNLIFNSTLHDVQLLLDISGEVVQCRLRFVEEGHDDCVVLWSRDDEAEGGVKTETRLRKFE